MSDYDSTKLLEERNAAIEFVNDLVQEKLLHGSNPSMLTKAKQLNFLSEDNKRLLEGRMADNTSPLQEAQRELKEAQQTIKSISFMLGWMNVPSREVLERTINSMNARILNTDRELNEAKEKLGHVRQSIADSLPDNNEE